MKCTDCGQEIKPVVAVDIDGTLGDYHCHFARFAENWLDVLLPKHYDGGMEFNEFLGIEKEVYRKIKLAYRQGGAKRTMPGLPAAREFMALTQSYGVELWIATTRPWASLDSIDPDTQEWLRRNNIAYDFVVFGEDKWDDLANRVDPERVVAVVDDLTEYLSAAENLYGWPAFQPMNEHTAGNPWNKRKLLPEISNDIYDLIEDWRRQNV